MSSTAPIYSNLLYTTGSQQTNATSDRTLGKDDFLNLLITQLKNQDPLNPLKDNEFIAQLASFSSLEQMNNMNKNMEGFIAMQQLQNVAIAATMIGKSITTIDGKSGVVSGLSLEDEGLFLTVDGNKVPLTDVKEINNAEA